MCKRPGYTLIELAVVLTLGTIIAALATPPLVKARHVFAVRSAVAELAGLTALTRAAAISSGGATLVVDLATGTARIESADGHMLSDPHPIGRRHHVSIEADRTSPLRIRYDPLGIGRLAAATVRVRRGDVAATLTISAYGRVRQ
jgi:prepilin-type N-terminal cleavage/methylation domain-containing protein